MCNRAEQGARNGDYQHMLNEDELPNISAYILEERDLPLLADFDCCSDGAPRQEWHDDLDGYIRENALADTERGISTTWVFYDASEPFAYVSLSVDSIKIESGPAGPLTSAPVLLIGRLAVNKTHQCQKYGTAIIAWAIRRAREIRQRVGCRFVALHVHQTNVDAMRLYTELDFFEPEMDVLPADRLMLYDLIKQRK